MNQRDEYTHELISAFRDGELTPDEVARVEQLLTSSGVHRRTLEEIELLGGEIRALPAFRLDDHFPQRVLETARQVDPTIAATTDVWARPARKKPAGMRSWQVGIPLALVAAATVLIALFLGVGKDGAGEGDLPNSRSVARTDVKQPEVARLPEPVGPGVDARMSDVAVRPAAEPPTADPERAAAGPQDGMPNAPQVVPSSTVVQSIPLAPSAEPDAVPSQHDSMVADSQNPAAAQISSVAPQANVPGAPASDASTGSRVVPAPDASHAMTVPLMGTQKMLLVIDVELTRAGAEEGGFERALNALRIAFDTNISVKPDLENALLNSRFFTPAKDPRNPSETVSVQLVYVVAQGGAIDNLWQYMKQNEAQFARVTMDMAVKPSDMAVFQQLQQLADSPAMPLADSSESPSARHGAVAHRLVLPHSWNGTPVAAAPGHGGLPGLLPDLPKSLPPQPDMAGGVPGGLTLGPDGGRSPGLMGENIYAEALLVVRGASDK